VQCFVECRAGTWHLVVSAATAAPTSKWRLCRCTAVWLYGESGGAPLAPPPMLSLRAGGDPRGLPPSLPPLAAAVRGVVDVEVAAEAPPAPRHTLLGMCAVAALHSRYVLPRLCSDRCGTDFTRMIVTTHCDKTATNAWHRLRMNQFECITCAC
jgi:hypothetical protein